MKTVLFLLLAFTSLATTAAPFEYMWQVRDLVRTNDDAVILRDDKGRRLKRIETKQLVYIYSAVQAIQEAAEIQALIILVDGDQPNAFATKARARIPQDGTEEGKTERGDAAQGTLLGDEQELNEENSVEINVVGINFAMLDMLQLNVHMMAALLGHELAHLKLHHGEESREKRPQTTIRNAASTRYSRDNEREADYLGAVWSVEAGYDPHGAVELQEMLYKNSRFRGGAFVGSHPSSTERIAILKSLARRLSK